MTVTEDFICFTCKHFNKDKPGCKAFDEIPVEFISDNGHKNVIPDQKGDFVYEPVDVTS